MSYASVTDPKHFVYDSASTSCGTMSNPAGRLTEAYTGLSSPKKTDLCFSYSNRGNILSKGWQQRLADAVRSMPGMSPGVVYRITVVNWPVCPAGQSNMGADGHCDKPLSSTAQATVNQIGRDLSKKNICSVLNGATGGDVSLVGTPAVKLFPQLTPFAVGQWAQRVAVRAVCSGD
jgi:hypothetical protein